MELEPKDPALEMAKAAAEGAARESVNKIANALCIPFPYLGIKRRAVDAYVKSIEEGNYSPDEKYLLISQAKKHYKELRNQMKIAQVAQEIAAPGTDFSMHSKVDDDWLARFMDAGKFVSDEEMQLLWGNVLSGEFESPGSTPPSIIRILSELSKRYAQIFANVCSLQVDVLFDSGEKFIKEEVCIICTNELHDYLGDLNITFETMRTLDKLGLIHFDARSALAVFENEPVSEYVHIVSGTYAMTVFLQEEDGLRKLPIGEVSLTDAGECLAKYVMRQHSKQHMETIKKFFQTRSIPVLEKPKLKVTATVKPGTGTEYSYERI